MTPPYVPKPDLEEINYSSKISFSGYTRLILGTAAIIVAFVAICGVVGEYLLLALGPGVERYVFGLSLAGSGNSKRLDEGEAILHRLIGDEASAYHIVVRCSDTPNAFAVPGRAIIVTSGFLKKVKSEQGLAFVLGHEYGHFEHHDHLRGLGFALGVSISLGIVGLEETAQWLTDLSEKVVSRSFSRDQEWDADGTAIRLFNKAYGKSSGASEFFDEMFSIRADQALDKVFSTHPLTSERINRIRHETALGATAPTTPLQIHLENLCS